MSSWRELAQQKLFTQAEPLLLAHYAQSVPPSDHEVEYAWFYEEWADEVQHTETAYASTLYRKALASYELYTSWATNGPEAMLRLEDVNRVRRKLQNLEAAL